MASACRRIAGVKPSPSKSENKSTIATAASGLRTLVHATKPGELLGSEEALTAKLGVSRTTIRQVARLLESEGLLRVRRGINGGYFASQPDLQTIETTVSAYLDMVDANVEDTTVVGSVLWVEVVRRAARASGPEAKVLTARLRTKVAALKSTATFDEVLKFEQESRTAIFKLIKSRYIELIFQINAAFAQGHFPSRPSDRDDTPEHQEFVLAWRSAKLLEFDAIANGDEELSVVAARRSRALWYQRLWGRANQP
jgi:GntR family transcriptional repressor for pyruvate dehydrogenase complex